MENTLSSVGAGPKPRSLLLVMLGFAALAMSCSDDPAKVGPRSPTIETDTGPSSSTDASPNPTDPSSPTDTAETAPGGHDTATAPDSGAPPSPTSGAGLFAEHRASCLGDDARGHTAVAPRPWSGERTALVDHLDLGAMANANNASGDKHISYVAAKQTAPPEDNRRTGDGPLSGLS